VIVPHSEGTVKGCHSKASSPISRKVHTFRSSSYLEGLMAELDRAAISIRMGQSRETAGPTQPEIAEMLEPPVHFRTVQDWESPKMHVVPFDRLDEWARLTKTTREWLLYGEEAKADDDRLDEALAELAGLREQLGEALVLLQQLQAKPASRRAKR
jgi:hypothetical protein